MTGIPFWRSELFKQELRLINAKRADLNDTRRPVDPDRPIDTETNSPHDSALLGLALSGGGIRSATFCLGVIQVLARAGILRSVDYLSTVSGGGYIGSWLTALLYRRRKDCKDAPSFWKEIESALGCSCAAGPGEEAPEVSWLRGYSNYLSPNPGIFSADFWSMITIWFRNTILNLMMLAGLFGSVLLLPRLAAALLFDRHASKVATDAGPVWPLILGFAVFAALLCWLCWRIFAALGNPGKTFREGEAALWSAGLCLGASLLASIWFNGYRLLEFLPLLGASFAVAFLLVFFSTWNRDNKSISIWAARIGAALVSAVLFSASVEYLAGVVRLWRQAPGGGLRATTFAPSGILAVFTLAIILMTGIMGRRMDDRLREWWSRLGAWIALVAVSLLTASAITFYGPLILMKLSHSWQLHVAGAGWLLTGLASLAGGWSEKSGGGGRSLKWLDKALGVLPHVFVLGILLAIAAGVDQIAHLQRADCSWPGNDKTVSRCQSAGGWAPDIWSVIRNVNPWDADDTGLRTLPLLTSKASRENALSFAYFSRIEEQHARQCFILLLVSMGICALFTWRIDINEFSMHSFYRNRLVRAYLGASRSRKKDDRQPDSFTGLDSGDDLRLDSLYPDPAPANEPVHRGPYPIINAAINLAASERGTQERRAACFAMTPRVSGYTLNREHKTCYGATPDLMSSADGLQLGTAVAISGAAASPNMGYHTSAPLAFLMTLFNVRLGWWMPNPAGILSDSRAYSRWALPGPRIGLLPMVAELAAMADDSGRFVYLSDGGHFENLAVYELLRRRCRFIICCDAEEDAALNFESLGGLVRKAREDFGIEITIDTTPISLRDSRGFSKAHCVAGVIRYPESERGGTLLYLKSSITGNEPADVLEYKRTHPQFPHQTTGDQFFSESQFESYRRLGEHVASRALNPATNSSGRLPLDPANGLVDLSQVFLEARRAWQYPALEEPPAAPHAWGARLEDLNRRLRTEPLLGFLNSQFYPEWRQVRPGGEQSWWPLPERQFAAAFHYCVDILRLMQEVHAALDLEHRANHPDCRGWMNQFMYWTGSDMLRLTYTLAGANLSGRFQSYARRILRLELGEITAGGPHEHYNQYERRLQNGLRDWSQTHPVVGLPAKHQLGFLPLVLHFKPLFPDQMAIEGGQDGTIPITVGFAAIHGSPGETEGLLYWIRIRNHLRRLGLGRQAVNGLTKFAPKLAMVPLSHFDADANDWWEFRTPWFHQWARRYVPLFAAPAPEEQKQ